MSDQVGGYKPQDQNYELGNLVCPNCGLYVPDEQYNRTTQLIKCENCDFIFAFDPDRDTQIDPLEMDNIDVGDPIPTIKRPNFLLPILILLLAIIGLVIVKLIS